MQASSPKFFIRKATKHSLKIIKQYYSDENEIEIDSYSNTVAEECLRDETRSSVISDGSLFFVSRSIDVTNPGQVLLAAYAQTSLNGDRITTARVRHLARRKEHVNSFQGPETQIPPDDLEYFVAVLERYVCSQKCDKISFDLPLGSPWLNFLTELGGYEIAAHQVPGPGELEVSLEKVLPLSFFGNASKWNDLLPWYLRFSFGPIAPDLEASLQEFQSNQILPIKFQLKQNADSLVVPGGTDLLITPVSVIGPDQAQAESEDLKNRQGAIFCAAEAGATECNCLPRCQIITKEIALGALKWQREGIARQNKTIESELPAEYLEEWHKLKLGPDAEARHGLVVEIDRSSYLQIFEKFLSSNSENEDNLPLNFFDQAPFGDAVANGTTIFFFVWDAHTGSSHDHSKGVKIEGSKNGAFCAYGTIEEVEVKAIKKFKSEFEEYKPGSIFDDSEFLNQYFDDDAVLFKISNFKGFYANTVATGKQTFEGVGYEKFLEIVFPTNAQRMLEYPEEAFSLVPSWEIGKSYLNKEETSLLIKSIDSALGEKSTSLFQKTESEEIQHSQTNSTRTSDDDQKSAYYWIKLENTDPNWLETNSTQVGNNTREDVFLSFATSDNHAVSEDHGAWRDKFLEQLNPRLDAANFNDVYHYTHRERGTTIGDEWPRTLAWKMRSCRAALVLMSDQYVSAPVCRKWELPYLAWRQKYHSSDFRLFIANINHQHDYFKTISFRNHNGTMDKLDISNIVHDGGAVDPANPGTRANEQIADLATLKSMRRDHILRDRIVGISTAILEYLKKNRDQPKS